MPAEFFLCVFYCVTSVLCTLSYFTQLMSCLRSGPVVIKLEYSLRLIIKHVSASSQSLSFIFSFKMTDYRFITSRPGFAITALVKRELITSLISSVM